MGNRKTQQKTREKLRDPPRKLGKNYEEPQRKPKCPYLRGMPLVWRLMRGGGRESDRLSIIILALKFAGRPAVAVLLEGGIDITNARTKVKWRSARVGQI